MVLILIFCVYVYIIATHLSMKFRNLHKFVVHRANNNVRNEMYINDRIQGFIYNVRHAGVGRQIAFYRNSICMYTYCYKTQHNQEYGFVYFVRGRWVRTIRREYKNKCILDATYVLSKEYEALTTYRIKHIKYAMVNNVCRVTSVEYTSIIDKDVLYKKTYMYDATGYTVSIRIHTTLNRRVKLV